ncbi:MAG: 50S ribosomal protein L17 [Bacteroidales bacterium]|nr:50S ribosomal protein L17 [Bacteroidales bacterium]
MRHRKSFNHLGRTRSHRKAMLSNMAASLIMHKRINTTVAKAKALRMYVEPLLTKAKEDTTHSRRVVFSYLQDKFAVTELFREISGKIADRPGGYTRVIKLGKRLGDNAEMAMIELVDYNEHMLSEKAGKKKKTTRRRGGKKKVADTVVAETTAPKVEEPKAEVKEEAKAEAKEAKPEEKKEAKAETKAEAKKPEVKNTDDKKEE